MMNRRNFLKGAALVGGAAMLPFPALSSGTNTAAATASSATGPFKISLAQWSLRDLFWKKKIDPIDFPVFTDETFGIKGVEYVNGFFKNKAKDQDFLKGLKQRCDDRGMSSVLIMCDGEGHLGDPDAKKRKRAVENHYRWVEAAKFLGCHSIRVNAHSRGSRDEQSKLCADGLHHLAQFGKQHDIDILVENHGGWSSDADWVMQTLVRAQMSNCGTLPDFGNFGNKDRYEGTRKMMYRATGVSAKSTHFLPNGEDKHSDFQRLMDIVHESGYHGWVGIEYGGGGDLVKGVRQTQDLLNKCFQKYSK